MTVYLVGAGPGDPGLLTRRGAELLARADAVVFDRLVSTELLDLVPAAAQRVDVGKRAGHAAMSQSAINELLVELGTSSSCVVRLKGGDPFVFGRGGEEAIALGDAGVAYEVVPGVSSVAAVPAVAGIPLTHRGLASSVAVLTGHDPRALATSASDTLAAADTLVVLMAGATRAEVARSLLAAGRAPDTPAAVIAAGSTSAQRVLRTSLGALADAPGGGEGDAPVLLVIGPVAALELRDGEPPALLGWRVVVTRAASQAGALAQALREAGADVIEVATIEIGPPEDGGAALAAALEGRPPSWLVLTSTNAVEAVFAVLHDARSLATAKVAAIGAATEQALRDRGVVPDLCPRRFTSSALLEAFPSPSGSGQRVLLPRSTVAPDDLPLGLERLGWVVETVPAYAVRSVPIAVEQRDALALADAVTFASPSAVAGYLEGLGASFVPPVVCSIGPSTTAALTAAGVEVTVEATQHTAAGLVRALVEWANGHPAPRSRPAAP